jgi:4-hydroxybenzoate polyprenyltransferase
MAWLRLIRWQNLIIILLTQWVVWWCIVLPGGPVVLHPTSFLLLSLSTAMIAAAGYIINDYFDIRIDQINRPQTVVLGKVIPRKQAIIAHTLLNVTAIAMAGRVAMQAQQYSLLLLQLACTGLLWVYSTTYKRRYVTGNLIVATLTALTVLVLYAYEPRLRALSFLSADVWILGVFAWFAFVLTWMREIVKDMEDMEGDAANGCITMPISRGLGYATTFITILAGIALVPLVVAGVALLQRGLALTGLYVLALLVLPLAAWAIGLRRGPALPQHYHRASRWLKIIMVSGICSLMVYKIQKDNRATNHTGLSVATPQAAHGNG